MPRLCTYVARLDEGSRRTDPPLGTVVAPNYAEAKRLARARWPEAASRGALYLRPPSSVPLGLLARALALDASPTDGR